MSNDGASGSSPSRDTVPCVVRRPQSPWYEAGTRSDPAVSVPIPMSAMPRPTADADPLDEPPGSRVGAALFDGVPWCAFRPVRLYANSSVRAIPRIEAPAARNAATAAAGAVPTGASRRYVGLPAPTGWPGTA